MLAIAGVGALWKAASLRGDLGKEWTPRVEDAEVGLADRATREALRLQDEITELIGSGASSLPRLATVDPAPLANRAKEFQKTLTVGARVPRDFRSWVEFNMSYEARQAGKFKKYAKLLDEDVNQNAVQGPSGIVAPYLVSDGDEWWLRSSALMDETVEAAPNGVEVLRIVATSGTQNLGVRLSEIEDEQVIVWVSDLKELEVMPTELVNYGESIRAAADRGQSCFALYGGFFSVLLASIGLNGACHGIGYGEHRSWPELPQSGPPPSRYCAPRFHRYIGQDLAYQLWSRDADLTGCSCPICKNGPPVLSYHDLMKHSVFARQAEIQRWAGFELDEACDQLRRESAQLEKDLDAAELPDPLLGPVSRVTAHLSRWVLALDQLGNA